VKDPEDFRALMLETDGPYRFFVTRVDFIQGEMKPEIRKILFDHFDPIFMLDLRGDEVESEVFNAFLRREVVDVRGGMIVFERKMSGTGSIPRTE
jgi:hypothetical protein